MPLLFKIFYPLIVLSVGFQDGLLFSKFSSGRWQGLDAVTLIALSVTLLASTCSYFRFGTAYSEPEATGKR